MSISGPNTPLICVMSAAEPSLSFSSSRDVSMWMLFGSTRGVRSGTQTHGDGQRSSWDEDRVNRAGGHKLSRHHISTVVVCISPRKNMCVGFERAHTGRFVWYVA